MIIETTGLADPAPVAQTFFVDEKVRELCAPGGLRGVARQHSKTDVSKRR